jgi:hypothetical protein
LTGRRNDVELHLMEPGDYGKCVDGAWLCRCPEGSGGNLSGHQVTEHEDGTITVSPSILITGSQGREHWHGFLEHGVWRSV